MRGVCCTCQEVHEVGYVGLPADVTEEDAEITYGDEIYYVMGDHKPSFMDEWCKGVGITPQALASDLEKGTMPHAYPERA